MRHDNKVQTQLQLQRQIQKQSIVQYTKVQYSIQRVQSIVVQQLQNANRALPQREKVRLQCLEIKTKNSVGQIPMNQCIIMSGAKT